MTGDPLERELTNALTEQTEAASPEFTAAVLARLEERPQSKPIYARPALAAAAAAVVLVIGVGIGLEFGDRPAPASAVADERELLLQEYTELQRELEQIRRLADEAGPVLYLGGDETLDVVYDLRGYQDGGATGGVRPASLPPDRG